MACSKLMSCDACSSAQCYFYSSLNGTCQCVSDLQFVPVNLAGFVRPGQACGQFESALCHSPTTERPNGQLESSTCTAYEVGFGLLSLGIIGAVLYKKRHGLVEIIWNRFGRWVQRSRWAFWRQGPPYDLVEEQRPLLQDVEAANQGRNGNDGQEDAVNDIRGEGGAGEQVNEGSGSSTEEEGSDEQAPAPNRPVTRSMTAAVSKEK